MPGQEVATIPERSTELVEWAGCPRPIPQYLTTLPWSHSDDEIADDIAQRILTADTPARVLELTETTKFEDLVGRRVLVNGFVMRPSDLEDGVGAYALISFEDLDSGDMGITTTSAGGVLAQLARMFQLGSIPFRAVVTEVQAKKKGHDNPKYFTKMEEPF
jgi:hypothetical protein